MPDQTHVLHCEEFDFVIEHTTEGDIDQRKPVTHYDLKLTDGTIIVELSKEELIQIQNFRMAHQ